VAGDIQFAGLRFTTLSFECAKASRRASGILVQITRTFLYQDRNTFLKLFIQFVQSQHGHLNLVTGWYWHLGMCRNML